MEAPGWGSLFFSEQAPLGLEQTSALLDTSRFHRSSICEVFGIRNNSKYLSNAKFEHNVSFVSPVGYDDQISFIETLNTASAMFHLNRC